MSNQSILGTICSSYDQFFDAEKKIADYIMEHKKEVVEMTVAELAKASKTSDATVSRFCRRCGFKGFQSLKIDLAKEVMEEERDSLQVSNEIDRSRLAQSLQNILANKMAEMTSTVGMLDPDNLETILRILETARTIQFVAVGNTIPVAMDGAFKFNQLGFPSVSSSIWEAQIAYTYNLGPRDVVLVISNSGTSRRLLELVRGAHENGARILVITNNASSPLATASDYKIITATREKLLTGEFWFSRIPAMLVIETLYLLLFVSKKDAAAHIRQHEDSIRPDKQG
ncbi:MurR/RpiR family transcriptional regulator [Clostridiaceae bacterium]|nr:MurR/RpiR family transcriptional regulator [Clostridiaceae bacterium]RKI12245.1 MurR/RpiR family transcriptional regulator [bacterium 1XD21-70]